MINRKAILVTIDNGLEYCDNDWDIVGIYSLDKLDKAREDAIQELQKFDEDWYRAATATIWKIWVDKPLDYTASDKLEVIDQRSI